MAERHERPGPGEPDASEDVERPSPRFGARKKTQATHTTLKVMNAGQRTRGIRKPARRFARRSARRRGTRRGARPRDEGPAAPCQRPPSSIVSIRLRYVCSAPAAVAAERDVEVVAQPASRARCASAARTPAATAREVRAVEVLRAARSRAAARARSPCRSSRRSRSRSGTRRRRRPSRISTAGVRRRSLKTRVDESRASVSAITTFLNSPPATRSRPGPARPCAGRAALELRQEIARAHDRPGDELREERTTGWRSRTSDAGSGLAAVDVDRVADIDWNV